MGQIWIFDDRYRLYLQMVLFNVVKFEKDFITQALSEEVIIADKLSVRPTISIKLLPEKFRIRKVYPDRFYIYK